MLTNSRLLELRSLNLKCNEAISDGNPTELAKAYVDLFELLEETSEGVDSSGVYAVHPSDLDPLFGK